MITPDDDNLAAVLWAGAGAAIYKVIGWVHSRLVVPRDSVQQGMLESMAKDISSIKKTVEDQSAAIHRNSERIATIEGIVRKSI